MPTQSRSPAELRNMFGANLRTLSRDHASISALTRQLGINRTQFNRYLSGESFPRPDVLDKICSFFGVDARILLEPVDTLRAETGLLNGPELRDFVGAGAFNITESEFPSGFYRFTRRGFIDRDRFVVGLVYVYRKKSGTYLRGFEPAEAMRQQGLPSTPEAREFRGFITRQEDGVGALVSRHGTMTSSFNYLSREHSFENNFWSGYVTRTVRESPTSTRVERLVYEHLGRDGAAARATARMAGYHAREDLLPFHARLLQPDVPFR